MRKSTRSGNLLLEPSTTNSKPWPEIVATEVWPAFAPSFRGFLARRQISIE